MELLSTIQTDVNSAKVYCIQQTAVNIALMKNGQAPVGISTITALKRLIRAITFQINANIIDANTNILYNCLLNAIAGFNSNYTVDPSVKIPGQTVIVAGNSGTIFNSGIITFTNANPVQILNYNSTLKQLYGNNPSIQRVLTNTEDLQTPATFNYQDNDLTKDLLSITYDDPAGILFTGYFKISGSIIGAIGGSGGGSSLLFTYSQADLVQDGDGSWYLPFSVPVGKRPVYTEVNQIELATIYYRNTARLYGFQDNSSSIIIVSVI